MKDEPGTMGAGADDSKAIAAGVANSNTVATGEVNSEAPRKEILKRSRRNRRLALIGGLIALMAAGVVLPPLINIGRYKSRITALMSSSLGRPVHLSSVELRLLPRPGFVLHDLSVSEDAGFGAEPILSARTVWASVRLLSLWRGKLAIDRVSVDEASLNLVRSSQGRWNLESLLMGPRPEQTVPGSTGLSTGAPVNSGIQAGGLSIHFPYLEATDSRVNLKNGVEKSPYSLVDTDLSLWQDSPGEWRVRLRGQPVRTDMEMSLADTGVVRMEARLRSAAQLREMPLNLQMEWRDAQLGQFSRLVLGSDAGWRGDVTADIAVQGTLDSAQTKGRLRATGVRREEFAPETPLDLDANCSLRYQRSQKAVHDLSCDTAIGDGRLHLKAELPGNVGEREATLEVNQIPVQAGLDLLRTVRSSFAPGISATGTASGILTYKEIAADEEDGKAKKPVSRTTAPRFSGAKSGADPATASLHGTLTVDGAELKGGELKERLVLPQMTWTPASVSSIAPERGTESGGAALVTRFTIALGPTAAAPEAGSQPAGSRPGDSQESTGPAAVQAITVRLSLGTRGYDAVFAGSAAIAKVRDLGYAFGLTHLDAVDSFRGGTADLNLTLQGRWIDSGDSDALSQPAVASAALPVGVEDANLAKKSGTIQTGPAKSGPARSKSIAVPEVEASPDRDSLSGSIELHHAQWKAAYLAEPAYFMQGTVTISGAKVAFNSDFSYGMVKELDPDAGKEVSKDAGKDADASPVRGSVVVKAATNCTAGVLSNGFSPPGGKAGDCEPQIQLRFGALDAGAVQAALLGVSEQKSLFSPLIDRMRSSGRAKWPEFAVNAQAESMVLGPTTLQKPAIRLRFRGSEVVLEEWEADLLGGSARGTGRFAWTGDKPEYAFDGAFHRISAAMAGALLGSPWAGGPVSGSGSIKLSGLSAKELAASATGDLRFDWLRGVLSTGGQASREVRFDDWSGMVAIQGGKVQIGENTMLAGRHGSTVAGAIPFGGPVKVTIAPSESNLVAHVGQSVSLPAVR